VYSLYAPIPFASPSFYHALARTFLEQHIGREFARTTSNQSSYNISLLGTSHILARLFDRTNEVAA
jgi:hypothetical protein